MTTTPSIDNLANGGRLTAEQSANFIAAMSDDSKLVRDDSLMDEAKACLHWYQRPFAALLISNPYLVKLVKAMGPSKWDLKVDAAERRAAEKAAKLALVAAL